jgi:hypothetical protein
MLRNFYDKVREIEEQTYKSKWIDNAQAAAIERKWTSFPISNSKVNLKLLRSGKYIGCT